MKRLEKTVALVLVLMLAFASLALVAGAADIGEKTIKITSVENAEGGTECSIDIILNKNTTIKKGDTFTIDITPGSFFKAVSPTDAEGYVSVAKTGEGAGTTTCTFTVEKDIAGNSSDTRLATISFVPKDEKQVGLVKVSGSYLKNGTTPVANVFYGDKDVKGDIDRLSIGVNVASTGKAATVKTTYYRIKVVFRRAMDPTLYHGSNIPDFYFDVPFYGVPVDGEASKDVALTTMDDVIALYKQLEVDKYGLNEWIVAHSNDGSAEVPVVDRGEGYDLYDFELNRDYVLFRGSQTISAYKYADDDSGNANTFTVVMDQVNVPKTVLMAAADAASKIDYAGFAKFGVTVANEAIHAFGAFADSLINADWPCASDVKANAGNTSASPATGSGTYLAGAIVLAVAMTAGIAVVVRKKDEDI